MLVVMHDFLWMAATHFCVVYECRLCHNDNIVSSSSSQKKYIASSKICIGQWNMFGANVFLSSLSICIMILPLFFQLYDFVLTFSI